MRENEMREILFRGKRTDNGEWVYGDLEYNTQGEEYICYWDDCCAYQSYKIDPVTRGEYIGLTDKNGVKIFEGDIIAGEGSQAKKDHFVIRWSAASCGFNAGEGKRVWPNLNQATVSAYEVIGNIHDNPELLEGGGEE